MRLDGATCLVTGASGGIGRATVARLSRAGARVAAAGRDATSLAGLGALTLPGDLSDAGYRDGLIPATERALGPVDVLVNNAGCGYAGAFARMPPETIAELTSLDLLVPMQLSRAALPGMVARGRGHLVQIGSIAGLLGVADEAVYSAAKGGLAQFTGALAEELAGTGVGVSYVAPGAVATDFFRRRGRPYQRRFPRPITPERVAAAIVTAIERDRLLVVLPRWLTVAARLNGVAPRAYRACSTRFGGDRAG